MSISEQVKELRELADGKIHYCEWKKSEILNQAADAIEALSAKLQEVNNNHPISPNECMEVDDDETYEGKCPCCGEVVFNHFRFCPDCGKELLWKVKKYEYRKAENTERSAEECGGGWIECESGKLPDKEVICCDVCGEIIIGYIHETYESEQTGFSAENSHEYMYNCVKWMEKPKP